MSMENKKQTAVEWFVEQLRNEEGIDFIPTSFLEQAKAMEKKQIIDASNGYTQTEYLGVTKGEQYYNETYEKNR